MKKKLFEKILTIVGIILALVFVAVLLTTVFGGIEYEEFDNSLVRGLFLALGAIYLVVSILILINLFSDNDIVKEIAVNRDRTGSTKATASIIKKLTKKYIKTVEGVKCTKVALLLTEYGVNLRINVKMENVEIKESTTYIKKLLDNVFDTTLDYKFHSIDFKVQALKSNYEPPVTELRTEADTEVLMEKTLKLKREAEEKAKNLEYDQKIDETVQAIAPVNSEAIEDASASGDVIAPEAEIVETSVVKKEETEVKAESLVEEATEVAEKEIKDTDKI